MTTNALIFFDTAPFIYLIEGHPTYFSRIETYMETADTLGCDFMTSLLTYSEFSVMPKRLNRLDLIQDFKDLLTDFDFDMPDVDIQVANLASDLRAKYHHLKGIDAFQLATAIHYQCDYFFTNDIKLKSVVEVNVVLVEDL